MRRRLAAAALTGFVLFVDQSGLAACGEKFLLGTRGTRFQQAPTARRAIALLVYAPQQSELAAMLAKLSVADRLQKAGYRPMIVKTAPALDAALSLGGWNVILVDGRDGDALRARADLGSALLLPVVPKHDKSADGFVRVIKSPSKADAFVQALDAIVAARRLPAGDRGNTH
jgi:hypothetical protein